MEDDTNLSVAIMYITIMPKPAVSRAGRGMRRIEDRTKMLLNNFSYLHLSSVYNIYT